MLDFMRGDMLDFTCGDTLDFTCGDTLDFTCWDMLDFTCTPTEYEIWSKGWSQSRLNQPLMEANNFILIECTAGFRLQALVRRPGFVEQREST